MKHKLITSMATVLFASSAYAQAPLDIIGTWECDVMYFTLDAASYKVGNKRTSLKSVEKIADGFYGIELKDGYRFTLSDVTEKTLTWQSPESGDLFDCYRK